MRDFPYPLAAIVALFLSAIGTAQETLPIDWPAAIKYADKWCSGGNDCPDGQFRPPSLSDDFPFIAFKNTDCTHFIGHILNAGGVKITGTTTNCASGILKRAKDLVPWLEDADKKFDNVLKVEGWEKTRANDIAIEMRVEQGRSEPRHVMLLADKCSDLDGKAGAKVYGHTNERCGKEFVEFDIKSAVFYRIESRPLDGVWNSTDTPSRFSLKIAGDQVDWTENNSAGNKLTRKVVIRPKNDGFTIQRPNDDEVLQFLGFPDAKLRQVIINANPKDSYIDIKLENGNLKAIWYGLAVRKNPNGFFKELIQPGSNSGKSMEFKKIK
jgi:Putative amidase domain